MTSESHTVNRQPSTVNRLLFISHKYPPTIGGMEKQSYELVQGMARTHTVHTVVHQSEKESKVAFFAKLKSRVKKVLREHPDIDVIHLNDGLMGLFCLWLRTYTKIPVVITFHGLDLVFPNAIYQRILRNKYTGYAGAICVSTATAEEAIKRGFAPEKVFVVPNGVDRQLADFQHDKQEALLFLREKFGRDFSDKKILVTLGRPVKRKGFSWFLKNVVPHLPADVSLLMIGPLSPPKRENFWSKIVPKSLRDRLELLTGGVNDEAEIRQLLQQEKYKNRVLQTGKLPFPRLLAMLNLADLFIMPNVKMPGDAEGFGLVALEASLCETVVLASNLEGIPEAIQDGKNGYLLPAGNAKVWTETIKKQLADPEKLRADGERFQRFTLENYGWEKMAAGYAEVFAEVRREVDR